MTAFAVGQGGKLIATGNGGDNWYVINTGSSVELWSIDFANDSIGYAIGSTVVLKTTNGGITFVNNGSNEVPSKFLLYQNYPNPFNPETIIRYELQAAAYVTLKIFDVTGKKITALVNREMNTGSYEVHWDASAYSSGIYFCRLQAGDYVQTQKMVLVK